MASGHSNKVIGQSGEFAVCAQLGKLGYVATPFSGNVPHFDVIVSTEDLRTIPIQVKATFGNSSWLVGDATSWLDIDYDEVSGVQTVKGPKSIPHPDLIMVYVWLSRRPGEPDRFFVLRKRDAQMLNLAGYSSWLQKHGGRRPRKQNSFHTVIDLCDLEPFENRWVLIEESIKALPPSD